MNDKDVKWAILRMGLWQRQEKVDATAIDWNRLLAWAKKQTLLGVLIDGIMMLPADQRPDESTMTKLTMWMVNNLQTHMRLNHQASKMMLFLAEHNIPSMLLKGQGIAQEYLSPESRQCGDIDLYIGKENYKKACDLVVGMDIANFDESVKHTNFFGEGVEIELHHKAVDLPSKKAERYFEEWALGILKHDTRSFIPQNDAFPILLPSVQYNSIYIFIHLFHHQFTSGIGLRQICDWMMVLHNGYGSIDLDLLKKQLNMAHLMEAWQVMGTILVTYLGLPSEEMPFYSPDKLTKGEKMLRLVDVGGNFGRGTNKPHKEYKFVIQRKYNNFIRAIKNNILMFRICPSYTLYYFPSYFIHRMKRWVIDHK